MRYLARTALGAALLGFGLCSLTYGIAALIEVGSCGPDSGGPAECPSGTGPLIGMLVSGGFLAILGSGLLASRGEPGGRAGDLGAGIAIGQLLFWAAAIPSGAIAVALALIDFHEDDPRPGLEVVAAALAPVLLIALGLAARRAGRGAARIEPGMRSELQPPMSSAAHVAQQMGLAPPSSTTDVQGRLAVLESQVRTGRMSPAEYEDERRRILAGR